MKSKCFWCCALLGLLILILALPAFADVIVEPNDLFYQTHRDECERVTSRSYLVNSEQGYIYVYKDPQLGTTMKGLSNGERVIVSYLYIDKNGGEWGCGNISEGGWYRMSELSLCYDSIAFFEEHGDDCVNYKQGSHTLEADMENPIIAWAYPGGELRQKLTWDPSDAIETAFTDELGNVWGYIAYERGLRDLWICLSDPHSETVGGYAAEENGISLKAEPLPSSKIPPSRGNIKVYVGIGIAVGCVVIGSACGIFILSRKKKKEA